MKSPWYFATAVCALVATQSALAKGRDIAVNHDKQVIEILPSRLRAPAATVGQITSILSTATTQTPQASAALAQQAITLARKTSDVRYLGRAQAALQPWWDRPDAPIELAVLQATVQQSRHEFADAHRVLTRALARKPLRDKQHAQGWLTLATLERVAGRYPAALAACAAVRSAGADLYADACQLETISLQGEQTAAGKGFQALLRGDLSPLTQAWINSLAGENEERAGQYLAALKAYRTSLALAPDGYTALALADLLLRSGSQADAARAAAALTHEPDSDAVLLRRAYAAKLQKNMAWKNISVELDERLAGLDQRGDDPATHARERSLKYLWLDGDGSRALQAAQLNLTLQKEPFDWWLALKSARLAGNSVEIRKIQATIASIGLRDARLHSP